MQRQKTCTSMKMSVRISYMHTSAELNPKGPPTMPASKEVEPDYSQLTPKAPENRFRGFVQGRTRVALAWIFAILLVLSARQNPTWPGIAVCFLGATIRFWASGFLRKDARPAVGGPYRWVRNPLYLGTYLMAVGTALAAQTWIVLALASVIFAVIYHYIILDEEIKLRELFGAPYLRYCELVPRFFPRLIPANRKALLEVNPETAHLNYDWILSRKNKAFEAYVTFAALIGTVWGIAHLWTFFTLN